MVWSQKSITERIMGKIQIGTDQTKAKLHAAKNQWVNERLKKKSEISWKQINKNITFQNLWDIAKEVLGG